MTILSRNRFGGAGSSGKIVYVINLSGIVLKFFTVSWSS